MRRLDPLARALGSTVVGALLIGSGLAPGVNAQTAPDQSDIVLVLDFSASILKEPAIRDRFAVALERIADRVNETSAEIVTADVTVTIVQFAAKAADHPGCVDLRLFGSTPAVAQFADCLRSVAGAYRKGLDPALTRKIGIDTNYVAAMERAAMHLPVDALRPAMVLFTDGRHDVQGVPVSEVAPARDRLFGSRSPFALLPVGMGLDPSQGDALEAGLAGLRIISEMPPCVSGSAFDWPQVVFESPDEAGNAVAVALQDATCTFTVAPTPTLPPTPVHAAAVVQRIGLTPVDGAIGLAWDRPLASAAAVVDYRMRCRAGDGDWIESTEGVSLATTGTVEGLTNGLVYRCEVAAVGSTSEPVWTPATTTATPMERPQPPGKPSVEALDRGLQITVSPDTGTGLSGYRYECSSDRGATWGDAVDVGSAVTTAQIGRLTNGVVYVCRAFAASAMGLSEASALSDAVSPGGSQLECHSQVQPAIGLLGFVLGGGLLAAFVALYREQRHGHVVAVVDVIHTANLGHGRHLGISFVRAAGTKHVSGILADRGRHAEIRIRQLRGGRFAVTDKAGRHVTLSGEPIVATDSRGVRHELVVRAFATKAASPVSSRR
jgi:hypothetical protein